MTFKRMTETCRRIIKLYVQNVCRCHRKHRTASDCPITFQLKHPSALHTNPHHNNSSLPTQLYWSTASQCIRQWMRYTFRPFSSQLRPSLKILLLHLSVRYNQWAITAVKPYTICSSANFPKINRYMQWRCDNMTLIEKHLVQRLKTAGSVYRALYTVESLSITVQLIKQCLTFWRRNYFFLILAHHVYKMWIIQEPNKLELWNKLHFKEEKSESIYRV